MFNKKQGQKEILLDADNIVFDSEEVEVIEIKDVGKEFRRYDIVEQLNDFFSEMLVNIPTTKKNPFPDKSNDVNSVASPWFVYKTCCLATMWQICLMSGAL